MRILRMLLLASAAVALCLPLVHCARVQTSLSVAVNTLFLPLLQRSLVAYRMANTLPPTSLVKITGQEDTFAAARAANRDFLVATTGVPDQLQGELTDIKAYPYEEKQAR